MRRRAACLFILTLLMTVKQAWSVDLMPDATHTRALVPADSSTSGVARVVLDQRLADLTLSGTSNLLLVSMGTTSAIPFVIRNGDDPDPELAGEAIALTIPSWATQEMAMVEIIVQVGTDGAIPARLTLGDETMDFHVRCSIDSSADCAIWSPLVPTQNLFYASGTPYARRSLLIPPTDDSFYRVMLVPASEGEQATLNAHVGRVVGSAGAPEIATEQLRMETAGAPHPGSAIKLRSRPFECKTVVDNPTNVFEFTSDAMPIHTLHANVGDWTGSLLLRVMSRHQSDGEWLELGRKTLYRFNLGTQSVADTTYRLDEAVRFLEYRLELSEPLATLQMGATGPDLLLQFACVSNELYRFYYGGVARGSPPFPELLEGPDIAFLLGAEEFIPPPAPPPPPPTPKPIPAEEMASGVTDEKKEAGGGHRELLQITLGLVAFCWLWFLGRQLGRGGQR